MARGRTSALFGWAAAALLLPSACASSLDVQPILPDGGGPALACWSEGTPCPVVPGSAGLILTLNAGAPIADADSVSISTSIGNVTDMVNVPLPPGGLPPTRDVWLRFVPGVAGPCGVSVQALDVNAKQIGNAGDMGGGRLVPDRSVQVQLWLR